MPYRHGTFGILYKILENNYEFENFKKEKEKKKVVFVQFSQCLLGGTGRLTNL